MSRDDAMRALDSTDWTGAAVEAEPRAVSFVYSVRIPADLSGHLDAEAERRGWAVESSRQLLRRRIELRDGWTEQRRNNRYQDDCRPNPIHNECADRRGRRADR